jgi:hypothetical protein
MRDFETDQEDYKLDRKQKLRQDYDRDYEHKQDKFANKRRRYVEPYKRQRINTQEFLDDDYDEHME